MCFHTVIIMLDTHFPLSKFTFKKAFMVPRLALHDSKVNTSQPLFLSRLSISRSHQLTPHYTSLQQPQPYPKTQPPSKHFLIHISKAPDQVIGRVMEYLTVADLVSCVLATREKSRLGQTVRKVFVQKVVREKNKPSLGAALLLFCQEGPTSLFRQHYEVLNPEFQLIKLDSQRTFPQKENQEILASVLHGFCRHTGIVYLQGMNQVCAHALMALPSLDSSSRLMRYIYVNANFKVLCSSDFSLLKSMNEDVSRQVKRKLPDFHELLEDIGISTDVFTTKWFLTLFTTLLSPHQINRLWLVYFSLGWRVLVSVAFEVFRFLAVNLDIFTIDHLKQQISHLKKSPRRQATILEQAVHRKCQPLSFGSSTRRHRGLSLYLSA